MGRVVRIIGELEMEWGGKGVAGWWRQISNIN